jgi:hypothetical protein
MTVKSNIHDKRVETLWNTPSRILILHQIESSPLIMNVGFDSHRNPEVGPGSYNLLGLRLLLSPIFASLGDGLGGLH